MLLSSKQGHAGELPKPGITYAGQPNLPRLPIPSLEETLERFPDLVTAIVKKEEMEELRKEVTKFLETDGPVVQKLLMEYEQKGREEGKVGSFVEEFWTDAYLTPDSSVVMNLNPFFVLEVCSHFSLFAYCIRPYVNTYVFDTAQCLTQDGPDTKKSNSQSRRAASLCFSAIKFASSLKNENIVPDSFRGKALCMDQYRVCNQSCATNFCYHIGFVSCNVLLSDAGFIWGMSRP